MMPEKRFDRAWIHKQSEVISWDKPKGMMPALYDEYIKAELVYDPRHVEELIEVTQGLRIYKDDDGELSAQAGEIIEQLTGGEG